jgi:predicted acyltransferase
LALIDDRGRWDEGTTSTADDPGLRESPSRESLLRESALRPAHEVHARTHQRARHADDATARVRSLRQPVTVETLPVIANQRVASIDALRGFTMIWILGGDGLAKAIAQMSENKGAVVSTVGGAIGRQFGHVNWQGYTFYDLIFPMFIFVTGVSIVYSLKRLVEREGKAAAHLRVLRRSLLLYALGLIEYGGMSESFAEVRYLGVLQRIAICYLFASLLFLNLRTRDLVLACVGLLVGYWALMTFVPVPDIGAGVFEKTTNLAWWLDMHYLPGRLWDQTRDPEGLLSTLPAIATCLFGVFAGLLLKESRMPPQQKSWWLIGAGAAMIAVGYLWGLQFPIIKYIWTSSFAFVAGGYALLLLGLFHQIIDVRGYRAWSTIFIWIGASAIVLYLTNMIVGFQPLATRLVGGDIGAWFDDALTLGAGSVLSHAVGLLLAIELAHFLYRRKIFLRV